ncbi:unnamed protein product [Rotaria sp. Silwood2]|nr:unnamed protein product [Rotaria sp. Silwood2]CAF2879753.1 unnamed protein product [Rotaria sp. Silwood2]
MIDNIKSTTVFKGGQRQTKPVRRIIRKFSNDWSMDFSAILAYNILITLLPIAVALFGIMDKVIHFFPADNTTQSGIKQVVDLAFDRLSKDAGFILGIGIFFALFGASRLFIAIDKCMTIVYRLPQRTFLRQNLLAFGMLFLFIIIIPIMLAASSAPTALISIIPGGSGRFGTFLAGMIFSLFFGFIFFESIYLFVPNKKMSFKVTWCGALVVAGTLEIFIIFFPLYDKLVLPLFFFYFATILILGAQINAFFFEHYKPLIDGLGIYISRMHQEHGVGEPTRPLCENETDIEQHQSDITTTDQSLSGKRWLKKLWPSRITSSAGHGGDGEL